MTTSHVRLRLAIVVAAMAILAIGCGTSHKDEFSLPALQPKASTELQGEYDYAQKKYAELQARLVKNPADAEALTQIAQIFITEARASGDHHYYYPAAMRTVDEALRLKPGEFIAVATKASILMTFHRFAEARDLIAPAVARNPYNAFSATVLIDALVELGDYDAAVGQCDSLLRLRPGLPAYARASYLRELHGDLDGARQVMRLAADAGVSGHEDRAWVVCQYANLYLQAGMIDTAAFLYNGILEERPGYAPALMGLGHVLCARNDRTGAVERFVQAAQASRDHIPLEQLAALYRATGQTAIADTLCNQVFASFAQHEREGWAIDREYAQFCADQGARLDDALARAKREYERRPENVDAAQTYAWVLVKSNRAADAVPIIDHAMRMHSQSPIVLFTAGMAHAAAGNRARATELLQQVTGPHCYLPPLYVDQARRALANLDHEG